MSNVNWWLMALAFIIGLLATFAFMIRRVKREVPVSAPLAGATDRRPQAAPVRTDVRREVSETDATRPIPVVESDTTGGPQTERVADVDGGGKDTDRGRFGLGAGAAAAGAAGAAGYAAHKTRGGSDDEPKTTAFRPPAEDTTEIRPRTRPGRGDDADAPTTGIAAGGAAAAGSAPKTNAFRPPVEDTKDFRTRAQTSDLRGDDPDATTRAFTTRAAGGDAAAQRAGATPGPYGVGSAAAAPGGTGPEGWAIKGTEDSRVWHGPDSPGYDNAVAEVWFVDEEAAEAAGFSPWHKGKKK